MQQLTGSSPLSRGIQSVVASRPGRLGIIPALAGNTALYILGGPARADHPRSRGEYAVSHLGRLVSGGSSPLSRGILGLRLLTTALTRIIPALAGNTRLSGLASWESPDHPRSRGEYNPWLPPARVV